MRKTLSLVVLAAGCGLLAASALASARQEPPSNTFRWSMSTDIDYVDPALAYYVPSWALEYATGAMLFNYPDAPAPRGSRLVAEVAADFPAISKDGKTYTFRLKRTYRFSSGRGVRAANFVRAIERVRSRRMASPGAKFGEDIENVRALGRHTLRISLKRPAGDLLARLAMPFFMATPTNFPINPEGIPAPVISAGPYFIREWTRHRRVVLQRNRFYRGPRPHRVDSILVDFGLPSATIKLNIDRGATDTGDIPPTAHAELGKQYGVKRRSPGRYFANPSPTLLYLAMNHDRPLFGGPTAIGNIRLKRAVNMAIDRQALLAQRGAYAGSAHDQLLPPTTRGFRDVEIYPSRPDLERARELAGGHLRSAEADFYCPSRSPGPQTCVMVQANLRAIGLDTDIKMLPPGCCYPDRDGRRGEPFDLSLKAWHEDYFDPYDFVFLVDGTTLRPSLNRNVSYFNHAGFNRRIQDARRLTGARRYAAFGSLDADITRNAAPVAVYGVPNDRHYVSARTGCYHYHPVYTYDLPAICLR